MASFHAVLRRLFLGGSRSGIAGSVYGTIVVMGTLTAGSAGVRADASDLAIVTSATVIVLWLAHVYAHGLGESLERTRAVTRAELVGIMHKESSIPLAAVGPVCALLLGAASVLKESTAVWVAFGIGVATLAAQGVRYARAEQLGRTGTFLAVAVNLALGLSLVLLKTAVVH